MVRLRHLLAPRAVAVGAAVLAALLGGRALLGQDEVPARPPTHASAGPVPPVGALGGPSRALDAAELEAWRRGRAVFDHDFHRADGLGAPEMNGDSCRACHQDPVIGGAGGLELNVSRFAYDAGGAGPFADLPGGQGASRLRPPWAAGREEYDPATADVFEQRQTPTLLGAGLIDGIAEATILAREDPDDLDGDGIRGVARRVDVDGTLEVGRFGWKAQIPRLVDFIRDAMGQECGITTSDDGRGFALVSDADAVPDPELAPADLDDLLLYLSLLAPPPRAGSTDPAVAAGEALFETVGCADCHVPTLPGADGPVALFSDLLCHDVHPASFRGMAEDGAEAGIYRTPPLWGLRDTAPYLHDGRAETIEAAILAHEGTAASSRAAFQALDEPDREALLRFLEDL